MNPTQIEYVDFTWNPITGCLGPGGTPEEPKRCPYCYAHRLAKGRLRHLYLSNQIVAPWCDPDDPFSPRFWPERLDEPMKRRQPSRIFVCDMSDLFGTWIPNLWFVKVMEQAYYASQHTYLYLTKNPARAKGVIFLNHQWLGTTVTNQEDWDERWPILGEVEAKVRWVSFEPLLGDLERWGPWNVEGVFKNRGPDWIVIGAQTGPNAKPVPRYTAIGLSYLADLWRIPTFHKDNLDCETLGIERRRDFPVAGPERR